MPLDDLDTGLDIFNQKPIKVLDEGVTQGGVNKLDFAGTGVTAAVSGSTATITITAGGGAHSLGGSAHNADTLANLQTKVSDATLLVQADVDDTPVDGVTTAPISSNWAFDHGAAADPHAGYRLESADHSHQSTGAQAGKLDHGLALDGLTDDDHTQYVLHALATAINDFLVASGSGAYVKKTLAEVLTILGKGAASGLASLSAGTLVVENPANATATPTASKIPIADGSGKLDSWVKAVIDADADTKIQVEEAADEDKIRMDVKGVESFLLDDAGVLTLIKQSAARAYRSGDQSISTATVTQIQLNAESYDIQNEFNISTYRFTASKAGMYLACAQQLYQAPLAGQAHVPMIYKNGAEACRGNMQTSTTGWTIAVVSDIISLAANDYLELYTWHSFGTGISVAGGATYTFLAICKVA